MVFGGITLYLEFFKVLYTTDVACEGKLSTSNNVLDGRFGIKQ